MGGDATAMRLHQSFMCMVENLTLSMAFCSLLIFFACLMAADYGFYSCFNFAKDWFMNAAFMISVVLQDFATDRQFAKFSNWSFILDGLHRGVFTIFGYTSVMAAFTACSFTVLFPVALAYMQGHVGA